MLLTEKHGDVDEEEDEVGEVAFAGEDAFWVGHVFHLSFLLDCLADLSF
jgi:hypothetical protein